VWLCSPETAAASALTGLITDPRDWARGANVKYPKLRLPERNSVNIAMLVPPLRDDEARRVEPVKGPNVSSLPELSALPDGIEAPVLLKVGDNVSTDEISPAGARALPYRYNIPKLAMFSFAQIDDSYPRRAQQASDTGHVVVGGDNYGQGSSREHAAIAPRYLGLRVVIAKSFARIHWQNVANYGVLALEFDRGDDYNKIEQDDILRIANLRHTVASADTVQVENITKKTSFTVRQHLSQRQVRDVLAGGLIPRLAEEEATRS
jgi:aconitate hydratase